MAGQDSINAAVTAINAAVTEIGVAVAAIQAGGTAVDTTQLDAATADLRPGQPQHLTQLPGGDQMTERDAIAADFADRDPDTVAILEALHLRQQISEECSDLAQRLAHALPDGPELTTRLRKLLEAKDANLEAATASLTAVAPPPAGP